MRRLRASEIGDYVYCRRAWWLRHVQGFASANVRDLARGTAVHRAHGQIVWAAVALRWLALLLGLAALVWWWFSLAH